MPKSSAKPVEPAAPRRPKVLIADDNEPNRELLEAYLAGVDCEIATAIDGADTLAQVAAFHPDVILLDLRLPGLGGIDAIPHIHAVAPAARIIVLSQSEESEDIFRAISAGVSGYLLKSASLTEIANGIRIVAAGEASLDRHVARHILETLRARSQAPATILTDREREILSLLAEGLLKKEIAKRLRIGYGTVDTHVSHIYAKLNVANAPAAVSRAYQCGLLLPSLAVPGR